MGEEREKGKLDTELYRHKYRGTRGESGLVLKRVIDYMLECVSNRQTVKPMPA